MAYRESSHAQSCVINYPKLEEMFAYISYRRVFTKQQEEENCPQQTVQPIRANSQ